MILTAPPQAGQTSMSIPETRLGRQFCARFQPLICSRWLPAQGRLRPQTAVAGQGRHLRFRLASTSKSAKAVNPGERNTETLGDQERAARPGTVGAILFGSSP